MRRSVPLLALALVAGCLGGEEAPDARAFTATGGMLSEGWAYDGVGLIPAQASLQGDTRDEENTGTVVAQFEAFGSAWRITFATFAEASGRTFQDGGIEHELDEHGDTGVADASIPRIHAHVAAWGSARVERDGALATSEPWTAHLMVSQDSVRGPDGKILKADGATPYDPATPADARRFEGDPQALLFVKHPQGETFSRAPANVSASVSCASPQCAESSEVVIEEGAAFLQLNLTTTGPDASLPFGSLGQGRFALLDAAGNEIASGDVSPQPTGGAPTATGALPLAGVALPLTLAVTGSGLFTVTATGAATFEDHPFLVLTWDDVTIV